MSHLLDFVLTGPDNGGLKMDPMDLAVDVGLMPDEMRNIFDTDMMSSEFFDSVFSMEKQNLEGGGSDLNQDLSSDLTSDCSAQSPMSHLFSDIHSADDYFFDHAEPLQDSVDNITLFGKENSETINGDNVLSVLEQNVQQNNINKILGVTSTPIHYIKQEPVSPKKVVITQPSVTTHVKTVPVKKTQLLRIQSIQGKGKPLLLPVHMKNMKKLRVINASDLKVNSIKVLPPQSSKRSNTESSVSSSESLDGDYEATNYNNSTNKYPPLHLTAEEKRLLMKEGITLPTHYPLSKQDEKELKRIRRKIRNKISAQDSRKRKKEYVDQLEEKARRTDEENEILKKKVKILNRENTRLSEQLKKLQDLLFSTSNKAAPTTCLMIVLFSTLLVCLPNLRAPAEKGDLEMTDQESVAARRVLLFDPKVQEDDSTVEEFLVFKKEESEPTFEDEDKENGTSAFVKYLGDLSKKYETLVRSNCTEILQGGSLHEFCKKHEGEFKNVLQNLRSILDKGGSPEEKKFIEPDIDGDGGDSDGRNRDRYTYLLDDDDPPTKKARRDVADYDEHASIPIFEVEISPAAESASVPVKE